MPHLVTQAPAPVVVLRYCSDRYPTPGADPATDSGRVILSATLTAPATSKKSAPALLAKGPLPQIAEYLALFNYRYAPGTNGIWVQP